MTQTRNANAMHRNAKRLDDCTRAFTTLPVEVGLWNVPAVDVDRSLGVRWFARLESRATGILPQDGKPELEVRMTERGSDAR
ncbi:MAG: hypothetical protein AB7F78_22760, partial [Hyphomicrobiaceae bacterium]